MERNYRDEREALDRVEWNRKIREMKKRQARAKRLQWLVLIAGTVLILAFVIGATMLIKAGKASSKNNADIQTKVERSDNLESKREKENTEESFELVTADQSELQNPEENWDSLNNQTDVSDVSGFVEMSKDDINPSILGKNNVTYSYKEATNYKTLGSDDMTSETAILVNVDTKEIEGGKSYKTRIIPASMTKVLTILVAAEHVDSIKETVVMSTEATDFSYSHDCSAVGFAKEEKVSVEDLFYGTILSSGGDAAVQLAIYVAGSQEAFVDMMNEKLRELGISDTAHFTNCVGIYDDNHYCTTYDMAVIMNAAIENEFCKKVMTAHKYTTSLTAEHPEGINISNWFLRRIEDKDTSGEVICAKTGYVVQSGNCAVSYSEQDDGRRYIAVTSNAHSAWRCIYDHVDIYKNC